MVSVCALGSNSGGQLATGTLDDAHCPTPCVFAGDPGSGSSWHVAGGGNHAFMWSPDGGRLLASGSSRDGELGTGLAGGAPVTAWTQVSPPAAGVRQVACGWNHTLLLDGTGCVWAAGSNSFGQLGQPAAQPGSPPRNGAWTRVVPGARDPAPPPAFVAVACGMRHSLALSEDGAVYGWGANRCGQLGLEPDRAAPNIPAAACVSAGLPAIAMVACGRSHSILLARDRTTVFVAGQDTYAQCGPSDAAPVAGTWRSFQLPRPALKLCAGWDFGAALLLPPDDGPAGGRVVAWGRSDHCQLACRAPSRRCSRDLVEVPLAGVRDLACGSNHCVAATRDGAVYAWGWNEHGNAGDPSLADVAQPLPVSTGQRAAAAVGCAYGSTFLVVQ
ncbi:alpha tubulin suppressor [Coemansia nantahalensis]|uniref:Alpha tubulin suppressor n=1 Tax=Coemansia nantahalensis TaxID=2789366 RepID=A0ACC1K0H7_9FUNG|nr:alpha tubulin suppressor [Coemansia nantahalensis]